MRLKPEKLNQNLKRENLDDYLEAIHPIPCGNDCRFGLLFRFRSGTAEAGSTTTPGISPIAERQRGFA
jgi:hypothetical protein